MLILLGLFGAVFSFGVEYRSHTSFLAHTPACIYAYGDVWCIDILLC